MNYDGDIDKIILDLPKLLKKCAGVRSDSEAGLMALAADEIERLAAIVNREGFVLVPLEPTEAMMDAVSGAEEPYKGSGTTHVEAYRAMVRQCIQSGEG